MKKIILVFCVTSFISSLNGMHEVHIANSQERPIEVQFVEMNGHTSIKALSKMTIKPQETRTFGLLYANTMLLKVYMLQHVAERTLQENRKHYCVVSSSKSQSLSIDHLAN